MHILCHHVDSIDAATIVMDANGDGQGLSLTYVDTANNIQFPNSSGTVILDSGRGVVNSQVRGLCFVFVFFNLNRYVNLCAQSF